MAIRYAYHPGNVAHSNAMEVADTMPLAAQTLGIELVPLEGATSCGAGIIRQANADLQVTLNAEHLPKLKQWAWTSSHLVQRLLPPSTRILLHFETIAN